MRGTRVEHQKHVELARLENFPNKIIQIGLERTFDIGANESKYISELLHSILEFESDLHRNYAKLFKLNHWFWDYKPSGLKLTPTFVAESNCGYVFDDSVEPAQSTQYGGCPFHTLIVFVDEYIHSKKQAEEKRIVLWDQLGELKSPRGDGPEVAVFGSHPNFSSWSMQCGDGGGIYSLNEWLSDAGKQWDSINQKVS
jgi:hypothetical protein